MKLHHTEAAPAAIGPYSQAVSIDGWLYTSGQVAIVPGTSELAGADFAAQARQVFANLRAVIAAAGCEPRHIVKATVYLKDMQDFPTLNEFYAEFMGTHRPARSTVEVAGLPKGALVEIDLVARCS
jgi:2-iminobutanoate/2-iminopropanoate deaminase